MALPAALGRQFGVFVAVGLAAAIAHYGLLIGLVEGYRVDPVPATLVGYVAGGIVSYLLNRRLTYASARPHREATWRFAAVAGTGFLITWAMVAGLVRGAGMPYLAAQLLTTAAVLFWSFGAHRLWTFRAPPP
ncbi:GtrA family protein [Enterovirga rhinocerotis]|uniref:Putative flippase GtrA n=1 Tax=Enterovirga rhinocerotis TaxID=1339210 RepID=A0A4R7BP08_9HYPH|nr:GtrA family protein [Enterovirga rhinocerotis]TDR87248.1 putative flippase GtrA [Enterovirga rhinocerotis]